MTTAADWKTPTLITPRLQGLCLFPCLLEAGHKTPCRFFLVPHRDRRCDCGCPGPQANARQPLAVVVRTCMGEGAERACPFYGGEWNSCHHPATPGRDLNSDAPHDAQGLEDYASPLHRENRGRPAWCALEADPVLVSATPIPLPARALQPRPCARPRAAGAPSCTRGMGHDGECAP